MKSSCILHELEKQNSNQHVHHYVDENFDKTILNQDNIKYILIDTDTASLIDLFIVQLRISLSQF